MKGVIHLRKKMTSESEIGFHCRFKCDTSVYEALCDARMKSWNSGKRFEGLSLEKGNWVAPKDQC